MDTVLLEFIVIFIMILLNGFFACSEFAIISARKSRIAQLADDGDLRAILVEELKLDPHRLLAVVQIGMTVTGATASTIGGIIAVNYLRPWLQRLDVDILHHAAEPIAVTCMVILISYLLLVLGELAPKTIGLQYADTIALHVARPINLLSRTGSIVVNILTISSKAVMRLIGIKGASETFITREEVQHIVAEGHESGVFSESENEYIRNVFEFTHTCVREVMVPRTRMIALDLAASQEEVLRTLLDNMYSRYPVYRDNIEEVVGVVHGKDLLGRLVIGEKLDLRSIMLPPFFVPEGKKVNELLKEMQKNRNHMALVVDEYGVFSGLVTTEDLIEELVGEIRDEHDFGETGEVQTMPDGSLMADGLMSIFDLAESLEEKLDASLPYDTVAGLILHELGHFPVTGETVDWQGHHFTCEEVTPTAILKVRISPIPQEQA